MTPRYLLDTDTCIHARRGRDVGIEQRFRALMPGDLAMSVITFGELHRGALRSVESTRALAVLRQFVEIVPVVALPVAAGDIYGGIRHGLERAGTVIGGNDLWIAAHAMAAGLVLVTGNTREFRRVKDLKVEDWIARR